MPSTAARISELLDAAVDAVNNGDLAAAHRLAALVLREDSGNQEAGELLATEGQSNGELRRLTILCCDLVGSTELSERHEPERYRTLVRRYQLMCRDIIEHRYDGHIVSVKGDGFLALFGYPTAHEDDSRRAVQCGLDLCAAMRQVSRQSEREAGEALDLRVGIHRGLVFVDTDEDDVYGLAANVASRVEGLANPGTVVITDEVRRQVSERFDVVPGTPQAVKGVSEPVRPLVVVAEHLEHPDHRFTTPLVGRSRELARLRSAWATARVGNESRPTAVLIRGETGIGKSRLAAAIAQEARDERVVVVELAGSPFHIGAGFHPVQVFLESRCGIHAETDAAERLLRLRDEIAASGADPAKTLPLLAPVLGLAPTAGYEPVASEGRKLNEDITAAISDYLVACLGGGAGVLVIEDLQWVDESTMALLGSLMQHGPAQLLLVLTSRTDTALPVPAVIELEPLPRHTRLELIDALAPEGLSDAERDAVVDRSDGVPLYLEELVRAAREDLPSAGPGATADRVPDPLYELLVARLLQPGQRVVAGAAATIGRDFDRALLEAVLEMAPDELDGALEALNTGQILVPAGRGGEAYRFRHELLRGVAYDLQPPSVRRRMHERVAEVLIGAESDELVDWNLAATHYDLAQHPAEAATAYANAADRARRRGALAEARERLSRSIELIAAIPDDRERMAREVAFRLRRGFLATSAEGVGCPEAASDYERCLELAMVDVYGDEMFSSLIALWAYYLSRAELDRARDVLVILRRSLIGSRELFRPANRAGFGMISWFEGDFATSRQALEEAAAGVAGAERSSSVDDFWFVPNDPTTSIHTHLALARFTAGDTAGADAAMTHSAELAAALDFPQGPWSAAYGAWLGSWMLAERGAFDCAAADVAGLIAASAQHGFDSWSMIGMTHQAAIESMRSLRKPGTTSEVAAQHALALGGMVELWKGLEVFVFLPFYLTITGAALAAADDTDAAWKAYHEALDLGDRTGMRFYAAETTRRLAHLDADESRVDELLRHALAIARAQCARPFELRIALDLHDLNGTSAMPTLERALRGMATDSSSLDLDDARARIVSG